MAPRLGLGGGVTANPASGLFGAPNLLLDNFSAHRAYSVRKLSKDYSGFAMKIRVDIDDDGATTPDKTADVAFDDDGFVSASSKIYNPSADGSDGDTLAEFVDTEDEVYCHTWYDQSGSGVNAVDKEAGGFFPTIANQPKIYTSNSLITDVTASGTPRAALLFDDADILHFTDSGLSFGNISVFITYRPAAAVHTAWCLKFESSGAKWFTHYQTGLSSYFYYNAGSAGAIGVDNGGGALLDKRRLYSFHAGTSARSQVINGTTVTDSSTDATTSALGGATAANIGIGKTFTAGPTGKVQELIVYATDQVSNNADIVSDINTALEVY